MHFLNSNLIKIMQKALFLITDTLTSIKIQQKNQVPKQDVIICSMRHNLETKFITN